MAAQQVRAVRATALTEGMMFPRIERTTQKRLDVLAELDRVIGTLMNFIAPGITPCLNDRKVVARPILLEDDVGEKAGIKLRRRRLRTKEPGCVLL